jgi:hypothetical protein
MKKQQIVFEDGMATLKTPYQKGKNIYYRKKAEVPIDKIFKQINDRGFLPQNTRYHRSYYKYDLYVTEHSPQMRNINIGMPMNQKWETFLKWCDRKGIRDGEEHFKNRIKVHNLTNWNNKFTFELLMPYIVYIVLVSQEYQIFESQIYLSDKPLVNLTSKLYKAPLFNIDSNQRICMGFMSDFRDLYKLSYTDLIDHMFKRYWNTPFNSDYRYNITSYRYKQHFNNYFIWDYLSTNDPFYILKSKLVRYGNVEFALGRIEERHRLRLNSNSSIFKRFVKAF